MRKTVFLALASLALSACGFQPVYGNQTSGAGAITVQQINGRLGHRLRQELDRTLRSGLPGVDDGAYLQIKVEESLERLSLKSDAGVSRTTMVGEAEYSLFNSDGIAVAKGEVLSQADYDVPNSSYGDIALQTDARERLALSLARRIKEQLILDAASLEPSSTNDGIAP